MARKGLSHVRRICTRFNSRFSTTRDWCRPLIRLHHLKPVPVGTEPGQETSAQRHGDAGHALLDRPVVGNTNPEVLADLGVGRLHAKYEAWVPDMKGAMGNHQSFPCANSSAISTPRTPFWCPLTPVNAVHSDAKIIEALPYRLLVMIVQVLATGDVYHVLGSTYREERDCLEKFGYRVHGEPVGPVTPRQTPVCQIFGGRVEGFAVPWVAVWIFWTAQRKKLE